MSAATDFAIKDEVIVRRYGATDSYRIGRLGLVVGFDRDYVEVVMNDDVHNEVILFLPSEIEKYVEPEPEDEPDHDDSEVDYDDLANYAIRLREYGNCFEYVHKPSDKVLIVTQFISMDTLIRIAVDHMEGSR